MKRRIEIAAFVAIVIVAICWIAWSLYHSHMIEGFRRDLVGKGFPEDYAGRLAELQFGHRDWIFEPIEISDLAWDKIVEKELTPSWNLVPAGKSYASYCAKNAKAYDSGAWYQASREAIAYFMDPRNWLNEREIFMFETLQFDERSQTLEAVEKTLSKTFMAGRKCGGATGTFAELLMDVGRRLKVNPVFLAGRLASEQGLGTPQAFGTLGDYLVGLSTNVAEKVGDADVWGKRFTRDGAATKKALGKGVSAYNGYYNFFNFRAYGLGLFEIKYNAWVEATADETRAKYLGPWNTQAKAIEGGAMKIKERYIDTHRHTRYFQKFSVLPAAKDFRWKQYMQNIAAPLVEARNTSKAYAAADTLDAPYRFLIPVYVAMPKARCPDPAGGKSIYSAFQ